jgi:hypothetical protein
MIEGRRGKLYLAAANATTILRNDSLQQLELHRAERGFIIFRIIPSLRYQRPYAVVAIQVQGIDPRELVPDLKVAQLVRRKLSGLQPRAGRVPVSPTLAEQLQVSRVRLDHSHPVRMEKVFYAEGPFFFGQGFRGLQAELEVAVPRPIARKRVELHEQRRHEVESDLHAREFAQ